MPKYYRQKLRIVDIIDGEQPGWMLPTERELAERFGTSRTTIRQAIAELVAEGRLDRVQGRGTFVAEPRIVHVRQLTSFSQDLAGIAESTILGMERVPVDGALAETLDVDDGTTVLRVDRVRGTGGEPLALQTAYLPMALEGFEHELQRIGSLYRTFAESYGVEIRVIDDEVETVLATHAEAAALRVEIGAPLLVIQRVARDGDGAVIESTRSVFRGDRFRFHAHLDLRDEQCAPPVTTR